MLHRAFIILIALAPLPLGSSRPIPWSVLALAIGLLLLGWAASAAWRPAHQVSLPEQLWPSLIGLGLVVLVVLLQIAPLTPRAWHHPLWLETGGVLGERVRAAVSVDPYRTVTALMRLLTYVGVFWLALQLGRARHGARRIVWAVAFVGLAYALYGLLAAPDSLLWWRRWAPMRGVTSTFVNQNHYATYAGLGLLCAFGLLVTTTYRLYARARQAGHSQGAALRRITWRGWWLAAAVVCLVIALVSTTSRAGFASSAIALAVLIVLLGKTQQMPQRAVRIAASAAATLGLAVLIFGGDDLTARLATTDLATEGRFPMYGRIAAAISDAPWLGTGYGTFETLFRSYQSVMARTHWDEAHNTYLENAFELGVPGALALSAAIAWIAWRCAAHVGRRHGSALYPCLGVAATVLVGLHALLDFSIELPAIAVTYATILGAAYGSTGEAGASRRRPRHRPAWQSSRHRLAIGATALVGLIVLALAVPRLAAQLIELPTQLVDRQLEAGLAPRLGQLDRAIASGQKALRWSADPDIGLRIGRAELHLAQRSKMPDNVRRSRLQRAAQALSWSLARAPANPTAWTQLAHVLVIGGGVAAPIDQALRLSVVTAPGHTGLMAERSAIAVFAWDRLSAPTRALFGSQFVQTLRVAPRRFAELVRRSPRIDVVRSELEDTPELLARLDRTLMILGKN